MLMTLRLFFAVLLAFPVLTANAGQAHVAVASNFLAPLKEIVKAYNKLSFDYITISSGSTGKLYAQIVNGAPFDVFLAANAREPQRLEQGGFALNRFTYARGKLALWSRTPGYLSPDPEQVLKQGQYRRLAYANPKTAPYGAAAQAVIHRLGLQQQLQGKIISGENVAQTYQFVASGNAELGFLALSQVMAYKDEYWLVPEDWYPPIEQQAVLLKRAKDNLAAKDFLQFLQSKWAQEIIHAMGYGS